MMRDNNNERGRRGVLLFVRICGVIVFFFILLYVFTTIGGPTTTIAGGGWVFNVLVDNFLKVSSMIRMEQTTQSSYKEPDPIQPTLLRVIDPESGLYVNAATNPLYSTLKEKLVKLMQHDMSPDEDITTEVDRHLEEGPREASSALAVPLHHESHISLLEPLTLFYSYIKHQDTERHYDLLKMDDIVALYCPANEADVTKFKDAFTVEQGQTMSLISLGEPTSGFSWDNDEHELGILSHFPSFPIMREETCEFRLYGERGYPGSKDDDNDNPSSSSSSFQLLARSPTLHLTNAREMPTGIHVGLTGNPSEMRIEFNTGNIHGTPVVAYGKAPSPFDDDNNDIDLNLKQEGTSKTYGAEDMCNEPANTTDVGAFIDPGLFHTITLTNLESDTWYAYQVGVTGGQGIVWSDVYRFQSPPYLTPDNDNDVVDFSNYTFSVLVYADQGVSGIGLVDFFGANDTARYTTREVNENNARMIHHFGDLSYARGVGHIWDQWMELIQPFTTRAPLMVGIGNHEYGYISSNSHNEGGGGNTDPSGENQEYQPKWGNFGNDSGGECGVPTAARFTTPSNGNGVFWYSYDFASLHTIMLSSEHDLSSKSRQYQWLLEDLKNVNRTITPWVIVELHRPLYESEFFPDNAKVAMFMRHEFETLLYNYKVDLVLAGHYHSYQRTCAGLYKGKCNKGGPTHITIGTAGARHYTTVLYPQHWTVASLSNFGIGRITVQNSTAMLFEFLANEYDGGVLDLVWFTK